MTENVFLIAMIRVTSIKCHVLLKREHNTFITGFTNDPTCIIVMNFYNQNMFQLYEN